jgi:hypothetical protein
MRPTDQFVLVIPGLNAMSLLVSRKISYQLLHGLLNFDHSILNPTHEKKIKRNPLMDFEAHGKLK